MIPRLEQLRYELSSIHASTSLQALRRTLTWVHLRYEYSSDLSQHGVTEHWGSLRAQLLEDKLCRDDCESFAIAVIEILWGVAYIPKNLLALVLTDTNQKDASRFDHCVGALKYQDSWYYFQCWNSEIHKDFIRGQKIVQYRAINSSWKPVRGGKL